MRRWMYPVFVGWSTTDPEQVSGFARPKAFHRNWTIPSTRKHKPAQSYGVHLCFSKFCRAPPTRVQRLGSCGDMDCVLAPSTLIQRNRFHHRYPRHSQKNKVVFTFPSPSCRYASSSGIMCAAPDCCVNTYPPTPALVTFRRHRLDAQRAWSRGHQDEPTGLEWVRIVLCAATAEDAARVTPATAAWKSLQRIFYRRQSLVLHV